MRHHVLPALRFAIALACVFPLAAPRAARAQDTSRDSLTRRLERLQRRLDSLERAGQRTEQRIMELDERTSGAPVAVRMTDTTQRTLLSARGIYGKPFVRRFGSGTAVGGYVDVEFRHSFTDRTHAFDQRRMVPFLFAEVTDRLHFGTEIEFEHGPALENADGKAEGAGEIKVEFATLDYRFNEALNLRGGVLLSPLGRFNLTHDSPINELTDRPLVAQQVIPSTLSEAGAGLFGTVYPTERSLLSYEAYVVNGFDAALGLPEGGRLPIRDAGGKRGDVANAPLNFVGRLAFSPMLGLELGASAHVGPYGGYGDTRPASGTTRNAEIWALDATLNHGPFDLLGEYARLHASLSDSVRALRTAPGREGFYLQGNVHFGQGWLPPTATSAFTGVIRYDFVNYQLGGGVPDRRRAMTLGLNWRPVPEAAFKGDVRWDWATEPTTNRYGPSTKRLALSMATYF